MTLRQTIQAAPNKTNELIGKLANTSNQALKTRESLFAELTTQLSEYIELEEGHLLPVLRKHPETKDLVVAALKGNKDLRAQLTELGAISKDTDAFIEKVNELQKGFQAHVRDERKDLLPAVLKALSDDEAAELAGNLESAQADVDTAKREAKREETARARRDAEAAEQADDVRRAAVRAEKAAERAATAKVGQAAAALKRGAANAQERTRAVAGSVARGTEQAASAVREALVTYRDSSQETVGDLRVVAGSTLTAVKVASEAGSAWVGFAKKLIALNVATSKQVIKCRSIGQLADAQRDYLKGSMRTLIEGRAQVLEIAQRASKQALNPLNGRLNEAA